jgi:hypothetical protein
VKKERFLKNCEKNGRQGFEARACWRHINNSRSEKMPDCLKLLAGFGTASVVNSLSV